MSNFYLANVDEITIPDSRYPGGHASVEQIQEAETGRIIWKRKYNFYVYLDTNGGCAARTAVAVVRRQNYPKVDDPTKTDHKFLSWNTKRDGTGSVFSFSGICELRQNLTVYAQWRICTTADDDMIFRYKLNSKLPDSLNVDCQDSSGNKNDPDRQVNCQYAEISGTYPTMKCASFNGIDSCFEIPDTTTNTNPISKLKYAGMTLMAWINIRRWNVNPYDNIEYINGWSILNKAATRESISEQVDRPRDYAFNIYIARPDIGESQFKWIGINEYNRPITNSAGIGTNINDQMDALINEWNHIAITTQIISSDTGDHFYEISTYINGSLSAINTIDIETYVDDRLNEKEYNNYAMTIGYDPYFKFMPNIYDFGYKSDIRGFNRPMSKDVIVAYLTKTITFNGNGGNKTTTCKIMYGQPFPADIRKNLPTYQHHTLIGWSLIKDGPVVFNADLSEEKTAFVDNITIYAVWETAKYLVTFNSGDGLCNEKSRYVEYNTAVGELPECQLDGNYHYGWCNNATKAEVNQNTLITGNVIFDALYLPKVIHLRIVETAGHPITITDDNIVSGFYHTNATTDASYLESLETISFYEKIELVYRARTPDNMSNQEVFSITARDNFEFGTYNGKFMWEIADRGAGTIGTHICEANHWYFWKVIKRINGSSSYYDGYISDGQTYDKDGKLIETYELDKSGPTNMGVIVSKMAIGIDGCVGGLEHWRGEIDIKNSYILITKGVIPYKIYYEIIRDNVIITFNANGGSCEEESRQLKTNSVIGPLPDAQREGYRFNGWFLQRSAKGDPVDETYVVRTNLTLYANFSVIGSINFRNKESYEWAEYTYEIIQPYLRKPNTLTYSYSTQEKTTHDRYWDYYAADNVDNEYTDYTGLALGVHSIIQQPFSDNVLINNKQIDQIEIFDPEIIIIDDYCFENVPLKMDKLELPYILSIGMHAFDLQKDSNPIHIDAPNLKYIGFSGCHIIDISSYNLPNLEIANSYAFSGCFAFSIYSIEFNKLKRISKNCFNNNTIKPVESFKLKTATFNSCEYIECQAFYYQAGLTRINIPQVKYIEHMAFVQCYSLKGINDDNIINLPSLTVLGADAFRDCSSITDVNIPNTYRCGQPDYTYYNPETMIQSSIYFDGTFRNCTSLTSIQCNSLQIVGSKCFYNCSNLSSLNLPNVTTIGQHAFDKCNSLTSVSCPKLTLLKAYNYLATNTQIKVLDLSEVDDPPMSEKPLVESAIDPDHTISIYVKNDEVKTKFENDSIWNYARQETGYGPVFIVKDKN